MFTSKGNPNWVAFFISGSFSLVRTKKSSPLARATEFEKKMQKWQSDLRDTPLDNSPTSSSSSEKY